MTRIEFRCVVPSVANLRDHWATKAKRNKAHRKATILAFFCAGMARRDKRPRLPVDVSLIRRAPRALDDDNNVSALKAVRDEVAKLLGCTDGPRDTRVSWAYGQAKGKPPAVVIEIRERP